jgi:AraC family transcriptional regulator
LHNRLVDSFGSDLRTCDLGGIRVSETLMPAGLELGEHAHDSGQICFVLEGTYRENGRVLSAGMMHVRGPRQLHANAFSLDEDALTLLISIDPLRWVEMPRRTIRMIGDVAAEMRREMRRGDDAARAALEGLSMLTMARLARVAPSEPEWLGDAVRYIETHFAEPLTLARVGDAIGVRRSTLAMAFRRCRNTSVGETIRAVRVARAKALLDANVPLAEVAFRCGFHDQAHFTRVFRAVTGATPGSYRSKSSKWVSARKS